MLSCKDITENANSYLDKELPFFTRMKVNLHLMMCVHCNSMQRFARLEI